MKNTDDNNCRQEPKDHSQRFERATILTLNLVVGLYAVTFFLGKLLSVAFMHIDQEPIMRFSSWLICYSSCGEYIRRGLAGELLWWINKCGIEPQFAIYALCVASCIAVMWWTIATAVRKGYNWWIFPLGFCAGGMFFAKTDFLFFFVVMLMISSFAKVENPVKRFILVNLFGIIAINIHESAFFFSVPLLMLLSWRGGGFLALLPSILAFGLSVVYKGTDEIAQKIVSGWSGVLTSGFWQPEHIADGASYLTCKAGWLLRLTTENLFLTCSYGIPNFLWLTGIFLGTLLAASKALTLYKNQLDCKTLPALLLIQAASLAPLAPFFWDYSRLFGLWLMSSYWFYLQFGEDRLKAALPFTVKLGIFEGRRLRWIVVVLLCVLGMSPVRFKLNICFSTSVVGHAIRTCIVTPRHAHGSIVEGLRYFSR